MEAVHSPQVSKKSDEYHYKNNTQVIIESEYCPVDIGKLAPPKWYNHQEAKKEHPADHNNRAVPVHQWFYHHEIYGVRGGIHKNIEIAKGRTAGNGELF